MDYIVVHINIKPFSENYAEIIEAEISDLGFDSFTIEEPFLNAYIPAENFSKQDFKTIVSGFQGGEFEISHETEYVKEQNWNATWESDFEPVIIGRKCTIKAPFHHNLPRSRYNITINPQMSFGTGHHQTTSLIVDTMIDDKSFIEGKKVLDMGCGTGILAIMAAKLGAASPIYAIDIEHICMVSAIENARRNRVSNKIRVLCGDASLIQANSYDIIFANINRNILLEDMATYHRALHPGGVIYMSGFFCEDIPLLEKEANRLGMHLYEHRAKENWALIKVKKD